MGSEAFNQVDGWTIGRDNVLVDGDEIRMYAAENDDKQWPSVSEILDARPTPEKDDAIQGWKDWLHSQRDRPNPNDIKRYKTSRGTLAHYKALDPLAARDLRTDDEYEAYAALKNWEYRHADALTQATDEIEWFIDEWRTIAEDEEIARHSETEDNAVVVDESNVRCVEQYIVDDEVGYAGQYDLAYDTHDNVSVLADLKSSKADSVAGLIDKKFPRYGMQLAAYARAAQFEVDELQVIWIAPDSRESAVLTESDWPRTRTEYEADFLGWADEFGDLL